MARDYRRKMGPGCAVLIYSENFAYAGGMTISEVEVAQRQGTKRGGLGMVVIVVVAVVSESSCFRFLVLVGAWWQILVDVNVHGVCAGLPSPRR